MSHQLIGKVILKCKIEVKSGLHIGAGKEQVKIGGIDNTVVRAALKNGAPIIPGSSLKGKIRSLLELVHGKNCLGEGHKVGNCPICQAFGGSTSGEESHGSRILFRDAYLTPESEAKLRNANLPLPYVEVKTETAIDRVTGRAKRGSLRQSERVPAGAEFETEIVVNLYNSDQEDKLIQLLRNGILLLNNDYLGGSGSRGYGHVELQVTEVKAKKVTKIQDSVQFEDDPQRQAKWKESLCK